MMMTNQLLKQLENWPEFVVNSQRGQHIDDILKIIRHAKTVPFLEMSFT
jgi:hypothetical protein